MESKINGKEILMTTVVKHEDAVMKMEFDYF